jgi:hypothetical protein
VYVLRLLVVVSNAFNLPIADDVNEFKLPSLLSKLPNLPLREELNAVKSIPSIVPVNSMEPETTMSFAKTTGVPPTDD